MLSRNSHMGAGNLSFKREVHEMLLSNKTPMVVFSSGEMSDISRQLKTVSGYSPLAWNWEARWRPKLGGEACVPYNFLNKVFSVDVWLDDGGRAIDNYEVEMSTSDFLLLYDRRQAVDRVLRTSAFHLCIKNPAKVEISHAFLVKRDGLVT